MELEVHSNFNTKSDDPEQEEKGGDETREAEVAGSKSQISDEMELNKVRLMRVFVQAKDPSAQEVDDLMMRRFLRARDMDVEKGGGMLLKYVKWRRSFVGAAGGCITASQIPYSLGQNKMFHQGRDKKGRPISVAFGARHFQSKGGLDEFKRFVVFSLDKICSRMPAGQEKFLAIADLQGWRYSNSDIRGYLGSLSILQDYYPERLGKLFLVHVPHIFMTAWKLVYPFIDKNTKEKIVFVDNKRLKSTLLEDIEESQLPDIYGGKQQLVPIEES